MRLERMMSFESMLSVDENVSPIKIVHRVGKTRDIKVGQKPDFSWGDITV